VRAVRSCVPCSKGSRDAPLTSSLSLQLSLLSLLGQRIDRDGFCRVLSSGCDTPAVHAFWQWVARAPSEAFQ
jgi:hypothetical protein